MKLIRVFFILLVLLIKTHVYAQDSLSIHFKTGLSKLHTAQTSVLNAIPIAYNLSDLDSVYFIGLADSAGDASLNLKLSEKRAKNTAAYCEKFIPETTVVRIIARGESSLEQAEKNRKVSIVLYFAKTKSDEIEPIEIVQEKGLCYTIDYNLLHHAHIRKITKGKKQMILMEVRQKDIENKEEHYYGTLTKKGEVEIKKVKWTAKKNGKKVPDASLLTTSVPNEDFQLFRLFKIMNPCDTCHEDLVKNKALINIDSSMQIEKELMQAIEIKQRLFYSNSIKIRAPRELINLEDSYFIGCDKDLLKWKAKRKKYYYSILPVSSLILENITRKREFCKFLPEPSDCHQPLIKLVPLGRVLPLITHAEVGSYYQSEEFIPYVGLNLIKEQEKCRYNVLLTIGKNTSFGGSVGFQYAFLSFPVNKGNPFSRWHKPSQYLSIDKFMRVYVGTQLRLTITKSKYNTLDHDIHLGLAAVNLGERSIIRYLYIQGGFMADYLNRRETDFNYIAQVGINIKLPSFEKNVPE